MFLSILCHDDSTMFQFLPPANEVWGKAMFLPACVILFTRGGGGESAYGGSASKAGWADLPQSEKTGGTHPTGMLSRFLFDRKKHQTQLNCLISVF